MIMRSQDQEHLAIIIVLLVVLVSMLFMGPEGCETLLYQQAIAY